MKKVLMSKMFIGGYNENSIGHEIINFYQPDNFEDSFIYNPPYGKGKKVDNVVLLGVPEKYAYPVLAIALNVEKVDDKSANKLASTIKYGGIALKDIDFDQKDVVTNTHNISQFTYRVPKGNLKKLPEILLDGTDKKVQKRIYIVPAVNNKFTKQMQEERIKELESKHCEVIVLEKENPQHSCAYCDCDDKYNKELNKLILDAQNFDDFDLLKVGLSKSISSINNNSFLHFIGKEHNEQAFTNMFYNVLNDGNNKYRNVLDDRDDKYIMLNSKTNTYRRDFVEFLLTAYNLENGTNLTLSSPNDFKIAREKITTGTTHKGRLDLLLYNEEYIIIIENKIKSQLNGIYEEEQKKYSQLDTYNEYAKKLKEEHKELANAKILTFLFVPNYSPLRDMKGTITYKQLYLYFKKVKTTILSNYYNEFLNGLLLHSLTRDDEINRRFLNAL